MVAGHSWWNRSTSLFVYCHLRSSLLTPWTMLSCFVALFPPWWKQKHAASWFRHAPPRALFKLALSLRPSFVTELPCDSWRPVYYTHGLAAARATRSTPQPTTWCAACWICSWRRSGTALGTAAASLWRNSPGAAACGCLPCSPCLPSALGGRGVAGRWRSWYVCRGNMHGRISKRDRGNPSMLYVN